MKILKDNKGCQACLINILIIWNKNNRVVGNGVKDVILEWKFRYGLRGTIGGKYDIKYE